MNVTYSRAELLVAVCFGLLLVFVTWSFLNYRAGKTAAQSAAENLQSCRHLAAQIRSLRERPVQAAMSLQPHSEMASQIEQTAQASQIPQSLIMRIDPQPSQRIEDSPYKQQSTQVELREVNLKQLIAFLLRLHTAPAKLQAEALRLSPPRLEGTGSQETWRAEVTLTHLVFAPINRTR